MAAARARSPEHDLDEPRPRSDAYVGMLVISLVAMILGCLFLFLDWNQYPESKAPKVQERPPKVTTP